MYEVKYNLYNEMAVNDQSIHLVLETDEYKDKNNKKVIKHDYYLNDAFKFSDYEYGTVHQQLGYIHLLVHDYFLISKWSIKETKFSDESIDMMKSTYESIFGDDYSDELDYTRTFLEFDSHIKLDKELSIRELASFFTNDINYTEITIKTYDINKKYENNINISDEVVNKYEDDLPIGLSVNGVIKYFSDSLYTHFKTKGLQHYNIIDITT